MFKFASENAEFVLNGDDDKLSTVTEVNGKKPIFFGLNRKNDYYAENIQNNADGGVLADLCFGEMCIRDSLKPVRRTEQTHRR